MHKLHLHYLSLFVQHLDVNYSLLSHVHHNYETLVNHDQ